MGEVIETVGRLQDMGLNELCAAHQRTADQLALIQDVIRRRRRQLKVQQVVEEATRTVRQQNQEAS